MPKNLLTGSLAECMYYALKLSRSTPSDPSSKSLPIMAASPESALGSNVPEPVPVFDPEPVPEPIVPITSAKRRRQRKDKLSVLAPAPESAPVSAPAPESAPVSALAP